MSQAVKYFLTLAIAITLLCGILFGTAQQILRLSAQDPQIQISSDLAYALSQGNDVAPLLPSHTINIAKSLDTFVILYNNKQQPISSTGLLNGKTPSLPSGVLEYTQTHKTHSVTWQPAEGLRYSAVITSCNGKTSGYVLAARSLTEVEKRIEFLLRNIIIGWVITLMTTFFLTVIFFRSKRKK